jgi:hypothetical protein
MARVRDLESKRELLIAQAEFDRLKLAMAVHDLRAVARPPIAAAARSAAHASAARLIGLALPILGFARAGRAVRALSIGLSIYRVLRGWRG